MKTIKLNESQLNEIADATKLTEFKFYNNVQRFLSDLLKDPVGAKVPFLLQANNIARNQLLYHLKSNGIINRYQKISDKDSQGNPKTARMVIRYSVPRKDFAKKMKRLFIDLVAKNVPEKIEKMLSEECSFDDQLKLMKGNPLTMGVIGNPKYRQTDEYAENFNKEKNHEIDECDGGAAPAGATNCQSSGAFVQPLFGVQRRKMPTDLEEDTTASSATQDGDISMGVAVPFGSDKETRDRTPGFSVERQENDLCHIVKNCINEVLLLENRESKSIKQTEKIIVSLFRNTYGDRLSQTVTDDQGQPILTQRGNEQTVLQYLERQVRATFFHNDYANIKFEPGIARIAYGELGMQANEDQQSLHKLGGILKILSQAHSDEYDSNLNGMSFTDLDNRFGKSVSDMGKEEQDRINNAEYNGNGNYTIVRINTFEEAKPFYKYTNPQSRWCLTHMQNMFDQYTVNGSNTLYFAYKNGFENIKPIEGEGCPLDEYGLSLLSIIMTPNYGDGGSLAYCTCRWNHDNGGSDSVMDAQELSNVLGGSVFKLCPSRKIEINIDGDLGLPSGTIWMTKNVGAQSETDYGKYFAWGMKEGFYENEFDSDMFCNEWYKQQETVDWNNFRFEDGSYAPSMEQLNELKDNCTYSFSTYKGVKGGMFTSKINGNSIFIPAAGYFSNGSRYSKGSYGLVWSGSLYTSSISGAYLLYFNSGGVNANGSGYRFYALSVRGVLA